MSGIYIHIPFCNQACHYCDFHFSVNRSYQEKMISSILEEIGIQRDYFKKPEEINTIYFGGGTPSLLSTSQIEKILSQISKNFVISLPSEISLEANPDDLSIKKCIELYGLGINRLSIGIQSMNDLVLKRLNRIHSSVQAKAGFYNAREAGFKNISIDLIYGMPPYFGQNLNQDIQELLKLNSEHISTYSLTLEEKTVFGDWAKKGKLKAMKEDNVAEEFEQITSTLQANNYEHYEISNFAKHGYISKHNSAYWKDKPYLGIGPGAHSYNLVSRQCNISNNMKYISSISNGILPCKVERLTLNDKVNEQILTQLRTSEGIDTKILKQKHGVNLIEVRQKYLVQQKKLETIYIKNGQIALTQKGKLLADRIASELFIYNKKAK